MPSSGKEIKAKIIADCTDFKVKINEIKKDISSLNHKNISSIGQKISRNTKTQLNETKNTLRDINSQINEFNKPIQPIFKQSTEDINR